MSKFKGSLLSCLFFFFIGYFFNIRASIQNVEWWRDQVIIPLLLEPGSSGKR
jgi:Kef-type K+ transport system membrane component KefB